MSDFSRDEYEASQEYASSICLNMEAPTPVPETDELTTAAIKSHLLEHMSQSSGRQHLLDDIESKKTVQDNLKEVFKNASNQETNVALLWAAFMKRWDLLEGFIMLGADLNHYEPSRGLGALHLACFSGCIPGAQFLIAQGCDVNAIYKSYAPLHCAAFGDCPEVAMILLSNGASIQALTNTASNSRETVLHCAVRANALACVKHFIREGCDVGQDGQYGSSPVHLAADLGRNQCLKILLKARGVRVNAKTKGRDHTALHFAAVNNYASCVNILLEREANPNMKNDMSQTPLHLAARAKAFKCVELLLAKGNANPNIVDCDKRSPLHAAVGSSPVCCDIIELLIKYGAHVNNQDQYGYTPLHIAALNMLPPCVKILIMHDADVTIKPKDGGMTPLSIIRSKMPASLKVITKKLDSAITLHQNPSHNVDLKLDFKCILRRTHHREISLLHTFIEEGQKELMLHPLCQAFLYLKWVKLRKYYIGKMLFYLTFVLSLSLYILTLSHDRYNHDEKTLNSTSWSMWQANLISIETQGLVLACVTFCEILRKIYGFEGYSSLGQYFSYPENILDWLVIVSVLVIFYTNKDCAYMWQNHVGAFAALFGWINLMLMIGQLPVLGLYVAMYTRVQKEFAKLLLAYACLLIGFSVSFAILFPRSSNFANPFVSLITVLVMMSGELSLDILENRDFKDSPILFEVSTQITFILFILFITIILMNLLVGIAVDDIKGLKKTAGLSKLVRQAKLISLTEMALFNEHLPQCYLNLLHWTTIVSSKSNVVIRNVKHAGRRERRLPGNVLEAAYKIAKRNRFSKRARSVEKLDENSEALDYAKCVSQIQSQMGKRDEQMEQLLQEVAELKDQVRMIVNHFTK